jgi:hypothetical protein
MDNGNADSNCFVTHIPDESATSKLLKALRATHQTYFLPINKIGWPVMKHASLKTKLTAQIFLIYFDPLTPPRLFGAFV